MERVFGVTVSVVDDNEVEFSCYSWIADSGATTHICTQQNAFENYTKLPKKEIKGLGDRPVITYGQGTVTLSSRVNNQIIKVHLTDTLYVPEARENIISLRRIDSIGGRAICGNRKIQIYDQHHCIIAIGTKKHNLYYLDAGTKHVPNQANIAIKMKTKYTWAEWHRRLGHIGISGLQHIHNKNLVNGMSIEDSPKELECNACIQAKQTRAPLPKTVSRWDHLSGELTHTDVWGPARVPSVNGYRYYISFVNDASQRVALYYMKTKDEASEKVKHYLTYIEHQGQKCPKVIRADNRCEYVNKDLIGWCHTKGIELQTTAPHTPEQNGIVERWNRTVVKLSRAMLIAHQLPSELWPEAMIYATYIQNHVFTCAVPNMTPYQKWTGNKPDISHIHEFGRAVWILVTESKKRAGVAPSSAAVLDGRRQLYSPKKRAGVAPSYSTLDRSKN